jgi:predicted nucleotidyltransferase
VSQDARRAAEQLIRLAQGDGLDELCSSLGIDLMVLFGSAARAEGEPHDVDLAVRFASSHGDVLRLLDELYLLTRFEGFDILDLRRARPVARERALVGCVPLYQSRSGLFANAQIAAIMERFDTEEMRRVELELLAE